MVYKARRSEFGVRAATSHTDALAGADRTYDALFRQTGVVRAETFTDLLDIPAALVAGRRIKGDRVAILPGDFQTPSALFKARQSDDACKHTRR